MEMRKWRSRSGSGSAEVEGREAEWRKQKWKCLGGRTEAEVKRKKKKKRVSLELARWLSLRCRCLVIERPFWFDFGSPVPQIASHGNVKESGPLHVSSASAATRLANTHALDAAAGVGQKVHYFSCCSSSLMNFGEIDPTCTPEVESWVGRLGGVGTGDGSHL